MKEPDFYQLDQNELDKEWIQQPELYFRHASELAEARREFEKAKAEKELVIAELDKEIRENPQQFGFEKMTEKLVESTIIRQKRYQTATHSYLKAKHEMDVAQVAVDTLEHRKKALEKLVDLWQGSYFSKPVSKSHNERMRQVETDNAFKSSGKKRKL